jgi:hypothetical protein
VPMALPSSVLTDVNLLALPILAAMLFEASSTMMVVGRPGGAGRGGRILGCDGSTPSKIAGRSKRLSPRSVSPAWRSSRSAGRKLLYPFPVRQTPREIPL